MPAKVRSFCKRHRAFLLSCALFALLCVLLARAGQRPDRYTVQAEWDAQARTLRVEQTEYICLPFERPVSVSAGKARRKGHVFAFGELFALFVAVTFYKTARGCVRQHRSETVSARERLLLFAFGAGAERRSEKVCLFASVEMSVYVLPFEREG